MFSTPLSKIRSRQVRELKLTGLIAYIMFYKIGKFESSTITNDVIMTSVPKTMTKFGPSRNQTNYISFDESYPKMYLLLSSSDYVKSYRHFCQILAFFTMPAHQIWSCQVTQEANFKSFYFVLILHLIFRKSTKFLVEKLSTSEVISQKPHPGGKHPQCL